MAKRKLSAALAVITGLALLYLLFWPVPIEPAAWTPPAPPPLAGVYATNTRLSGAERLGTGAGYAPEEPAFDAEGRLYTGLGDGRILRLQADGRAPEVFANTSGRPLGLKFDRARPGRGSSTRTSRDS